uniref:F-box domain-containing protein n=1 Tax=Metopus es TaxID=392813 RepID=A6MI35_9CILI|nr:hypothetical protein [Metopus es]
MYQMLSNNIQSIDMENKAEEKKAEEKKEVAKYQQPNFGKADPTGLLEEIRGYPLIKVLSYLPYKELITVAKSCKYAFSLFEKKEDKKKIMCWKPSKEEKAKIKKYIDTQIDELAKKKKAAAQLTNLEFTYSSELYVHLTSYQWITSFCVISQEMMNILFGKPLGLHQSCTQASIRLDK